ncbi:MAG TPA: metallophosphoesterase [Kineosporiaceae bacterium]|nr:metallophosphoesterase [Kineosporiaceae bacterium]
MSPPDPATPSAAAPRRRPVVIAHLSDLHLGAHDPESMGSLVADVTSAGPDLTVVTGDLTMRARRGEFEAVLQVLNALPRPRLTILGNHDVPLDPVRRLTRPYDVYQRYLPGPLDPVVEADGVRALGLQSMPRWRWKSGRVSRRQAGEIRRVLGSTPAGVIRLVAMHHPLSAGGLQTIAGRSGLVDALVAARIDLVLAGHTHIPMATGMSLAANGHTHRVVEVVAGTAMSTRLRGAPRSWNLIRIDASWITAQERRETGSRWSDEPPVEFPRVGPGSSGAAGGIADGVGDHAGDGVEAVAGEVAGDVAGDTGRRRP